MPEITHPNVQGTAVVDDRTVDFWLKQGWELVDAAADTGAVLVFARSHNDAKTAARAAGYPPRQWRYVDSPATLADTVADPGRPRLVTAGFTEHPEHAEIHAAAVTAGFTDLVPPTPDGA